MDALLVKIFATALTFSQVATAPEPKTQFDPVKDVPQVVSLLRGGCAQMRKAFDIEDLNIDDLIATAMDDPEAVASGHAAFKGINIKDLHTAYRQFCKNESVANSPVDVVAVIDFYNQTLADLPDHSRLKGLRLPGASVVLDLKGERFAEVFEQNQRRVWVPLADIPSHVQQAFIAAEDKRFYEHRGIDERALIRAFIGNLAQSGRPQGGSTITQQVVKNLLVGEDVTYERKIREMVLASRVESTLSKAEILELYLNSTYLGRNAWGIELAARSYFGKTAKTLSLGESALLAGLTKGPSYFNPDRHPDRAKDRFNYVLGRMEEDGAITAEQMRQTQAATPTLAAVERSRRDSGFHFVDNLTREAKAVAGIDGLTAQSYTVRSTIQPQLQRATELALQEGLARFEIDSGRLQFNGPEANLAEAIGRIEAAPKTAAAKPAWQQALAGARMPLYDVHWPAAVVIEKSPQKGGGEIIRVGLGDGRVLPLSVGKAAIQRGLKLHDVVLVRLSDPKAKTARAELRVRPVVQGSAIVLENKTGRILAMAGGFSYPLSQLNRATQSQRQPGSALKPVTYLAALQKGLQPNTLVRDEQITLPPMNGGAREQDYWTPKNYDGGASGVITLRRALEHSKNLATVNLLDGAIDQTPSLSLDRICALAIEAQVYKDCVRYYPFVLGAQPVRPIDLAAFYAAIANEGVRPAPYAIESIESEGSVVYRHVPTMAEIGSADRVSFFQLKSMLQGVLARGTARGLAGLAPYVAGKTGTTDGENDAWFVGFTNDVTVAVWVGYDNADGKRRTLGGGQTGASVAIPVFEPIIQAVWANHAPKAALAPPSPEAKRYLIASRGEPDNDDEAGKGSARGFTEYLRRDRNGQASDTRYRLVSREEMSSSQETDGYSSQVFPPWQQQPRNQPQTGGGLFGWGQRAPQQPPPQQQYQRSYQQPYQQPYQPYGQQQQRRRADPYWDRN
ncbi:MAG: penicillin-binding protein [Alphaproteobacteria bacterium]|jgi:1A family penicillin-binding protein|nr:penicillin-binding protein [Alphaproteobacteria bacterium]